MIDDLKKDIKNALDIASTVDYVNKRDFIYLDRAYRAVEDSFFAWEQDSNRKAFLDGFLDVAFSKRRGFVFLVLCEEENKEVFKINSKSSLFDADVLPELPEFLRLHLLKKVPTMKFTTISNPEVHLWR